MISSCLHINECPIPSGKLGIATQLPMHYHSLISNTCPSLLYKRVSDEVLKFPSSIVHPSPIICNCRMCNHLVGHDYDYY